MSFWSDNKVSDDFTPEDRYFYLYLLTNPHTNLCGCYEISIKNIANELGYNKDSVENLLKRFEEFHKVLKFSKETKEVLILNWSKYNWTTSEKFRKPLEKEIENIKNTDFKAFLIGILNNGQKVDTDFIDTHDKPIIVDNTLDNIKEIVDYFNEKCGTNYKYSTKSNQEHIRARLKEGFTIDDFKIVIDSQYDKWHNDTKMREYLRPITLFCNKFESYLNNAKSEKKSEIKVNESKWQ